ANSATTVVQTQSNINTTTPIAVAGLAAETYTVTITDDTTNCTATTTITIENPPAALDFTFADTPVTCIANSTITVTPIGGWGSYEYQLENTVGPAIVYAYQSPNSFTNIAPGTYTIYIRDAGDCIVTKPITIDPAEAPVIAIDASSDYCFDSVNQASLTITITDGVAPYTYSINGGGQTVVVGNPFTISNMIPGTYNIQVTDAYGCVSNVLSSTTIAPQLTAAAQVNKALDCTASPDAVIDVTVNNGYLPYATYEVSTNGGATWSATTAMAGSTFSYSASTAGTYDFRITDARGCQVIAQTTVAPISNPDITSLAQTTAILCNGDAGATIQVNLDNTQGLAPFAISVMNTTTSTNYGTQTSGLPAGTYVVTVTDAKSCTDTATISISEPDAITYDVNLVPITCNAGSGTDPGSITVENVLGGTAEFTYHLTGNNGYSATYATTSGGENHTFAILEFGIYEVDVVDANGCSLRKTNIIASPPNDLDIDVSTTTPDCTTGGTAIITVASIVGSGNYEFAILETFSPPYSSTYVPADVFGGDTATFTGLTPGITYTFVVHDLTTMCYYFETADSPIDSPSNLTSTLDAVNNVTCTGSNDGNVSFTFDNYEGDATSVTYEIFNSQSNVTTGITGSPAVNPPAVGTGVTVANAGPLPPGVYYILFTENGGSTYSGCSVASAQFTITESTNELAVTASVDKNDNCTVNAGQVSAIGQFGTAPYEYQIELSSATAPTPSTWTGSTANVFNVEGGNYIVYVKDANNCIRSAAALVPTDPSPEISLASANQCSANEGSFSIAITLDIAGITPHTIRVDGGAPQTANGLVSAGDIMTLTNLNSGTHSVQILDNNGCGETETITLYPPVNITANITVDDACVPANSGEVTITANGGSGTYSYTQTIPAGPTNATGLFTGLTHTVAYTFEVRDTTTNCTETVSITLPAPAVPTFDLAATDVSCNGGSDGTITVNLLPGNSDIPYEYSLDGGTTRQPSNVFTGRAQGTYNVTVISSKGCLATQAIDVNEPTVLAISASASVYSCDNATSTITATIDNDAFGNPSGTGPYVYSFNGGVNYQPGNTFNVPYGSAAVTVMVKDANHCTATQVVAIPASQGVAAVINRLQAIDCNNGQEIIEIVASNGSGSYTYVELPSGNPVADPTNIILTLPGTYIFEIQDTVTNCKITVEHVIAPYDLIDVTAVVTTDATCSDSTDGVVEVTLSGYTGTFDYQVLDSAGAPISGTLASGNATSDPYVFNVAGTLPAGTYSVRITETAFPQCTDVSNTVTIDAPEPLALQLVANVNATCNISDAIVTVQATGGTGPYTYGASISGGGIPGTFAFDNTVEVDPTTSLNWDIYVRDTNGCIIAVPLAVTVATDTTPDITLAIDDECADEGSFAITVSLNAGSTGIAPYTMSIDGGAFQSIASFPYTYTGLNAGAHAITIRDANGCGETENITIVPELLASALVISQPTCTTNDGVIEFTVTGGSGVYTAALLRSDLTATGITATGNQFIGVAYGSYIVRITDTTLGTPNCFADAPISLEEPTPVTLLAPSKTDVSCAGASDGSITVNMQTSSVGVNDNPPYTFEITDGTTTYTQDNINLFTGLTAGTWDITVTSNRNCVATSQAIVGEPTALDASITNVVPFACDVNNTKQIANIEVTITAGTGTPNYFYSVNGGSFLPTGGIIFTHPVTAAGSYDIVIRDNKGCLFTIPTQVIDPLNVFTATVAQSSTITCVNGREEVLITVADDGNPHSYTYELLPLGNPNGFQTATTGNTATFELTAVGSYTFRITDTTTGCYKDTATYDIAPYDLIEVTATAVDSVICFGDTNGSLEISVSGLTGTTGDYDYEVFTQAGASVLNGSGNIATNPFPITGLSGGNFYVVVTETDPTSTLCSDQTNVVTISSPDMPLTAIVDPLANVTCTNDQGEILVDPSGGVAPYDIVLTNTDTGQVYTANDVLSFVFTGLSAENYTVSITDSARTPGCILTDTEILVEPSQIVANAIPLITDLACFGDTNGTVTGNVISGGSGNYQYRLNTYDATGSTIAISSGPQSANTFAGLGAGIYSITVSDGWNCDVETNQVTITEPTKVFASLLRTDPLTCATGVEFELTATGGQSGSYDYSTDGTTWLPMTSNPMPLPPGSVTYYDGTYQFYVRDAVNLCTPVLSNSITEDAIVPLELTIDQAINISCNGDNTGAIYASAAFGMGNYLFEIFTDAALTNSVTGSAQSSGEFRNLIAGTYYVSVTSEDCTVAAQQVELVQPEPLVFTTDVVDVLCFGDENGSVTVTPSGGAGGYIFAISPNLAQFQTINEFKDLSPGNYTKIAQDQNGCFEYIEVTIGAPLALETSVVSTPEICMGSEDGTITISITGGTAPYRSALNSNNETDFVQDRVEFNDLAGGNYLIIVRDATDCETNVI
ncbi:MAG: SprB repeat-containing protein, partial [Flavobacteriaceae bacterium]